MHSYIKPTVKYGCGLNPMVNRSKQQTTVILIEVVRINSVWR